MKRIELLEEIERLQNERSPWGPKLASLVDDFENDRMTFDELAEIIEDYRRQLANEQAIADTQSRTRAETCLEALFKLAQAVA